MGLLIPGERALSSVFDTDSQEDLIPMSELMRQMFIHVQSRGKELFEAVTSVSQVCYLMHLARSEDARVIGEIGFNIGFSAMAFLESDPDAHVVSFELGRAPCVDAAKEFIDARYPGRHDLVIGNSAETVPAYSANNPIGQFDFVFVDGSHEYGYSKADIWNSHRLARGGAIIVVDDLTPWYPWGVGPTRAWEDAVQANLVSPLEYIVDGIPVTEIEGPADRAWATGRFTR